MRVASGVQAMPGASTIGNMAAGMSQAVSDAATAANATTKAITGTRVRRGMSQGEAKNYMTGAVIVIFALIFLAYFLPEAWEIFDGANLSQIPGGEFLGSGVFLLVVLALGMGLVLKAVDII